MRLVRRHELNLSHSDDPFWSHASSECSALNLNLRHPEVNNLVDNVHHYVEQEISSRVKKMFVYGVEELLYEDRD